ncbi:MAG: CoA transferase [Myxococcota bacterium]|nr:CoA transferase [Myxococcota bacterium]
MQASLDAAALWAHSGAMILTGRAERAPVVAPAAIAVAAERVASDLCALAAHDGIAMRLDGPALLGERAACFGGIRRGRVSVGGSAHLLRARDGWIAVNLPRADDRAAVPAWLAVRRDDVSDPWPFVAEVVRDRDVADLVARARLVGLAIAPVATPAPAPAPGAAFREIALDVARVPARGARPLVVDLSALWAGPLCGQLLAAAGARVVKVESTRRPDGARFGPAAFFDLLNGDKQSVALDFADARDVDALRRLVAAADVVIESARPRALRQLGVDAEAIVAARAGLVWVSITGYGREDDGVAFGDDAAAAGGLAALAGRDDDGPLFCGDAIADPLTGLYAAHAALAAWRRGGGVLLDVPLRDVAAHALGAAPPPCEAREDLPVAAPRVRPLRRRARSLGADTRAVLGAFA